MTSTIRPVGDDEWELIAWLWQAYRSDLASIVRGLPYADGRYAHGPLDGFMVGRMDGDRYPTLTGDAHRGLQFIHIYGSSIQLNLVILIDAHDRVIEFRRLLLSGLRFRQLNLHLRLIFFERCGDDKKYQQDDENIDERDDDDGGSAPFPDCDFHEERAAYPTGARAAAAAGAVVREGGSGSPLCGRP